MLGYRQTDRYIAIHRCTLVLHELMYMRLIDLPVEQTPNMHMHAYMHALTRLATKSESCGLFVIDHNRCVDDKE